jgi:uncharacterized membrane protein
MKYTTIFLIAVCSTTACENPTRSVDAGKIIPPIAEARPTAGPSITVTALPTGSRANGINDLGTIVGVGSNAAGAPAAVKWALANGGAWTATVLDGAGGTAAAINAAGDIVGTNGTHAILWPLGGNAVVLGCSTDVGSDRALAINLSGVVAGRTDNGTGAAAVWRTAGGCREELAPLSSGEWAEADNIDDAGIVSGYGTDPTIGGSTSAIRWTRNVDNTAWNPPERLKDGIYAGTAGTNRVGDIVGSVCAGVWPSCYTHAILWLYPGTATRTDLGTLGGRYSAAYAINSAREVAGWSYLAHTGNISGFIWSAAAGMRPLSALKGDNHSEAYGMTNALGDGSRMVVGFSQGNSGTRAVVWRIP